VSELNKSRSLRTRELTAKGELQTKKDFQKEWELKHTSLLTDVTYLWGLSIAVQDITQVYVFNKKEVGSGHYGCVRKAKRKVDKGKTYAVKTVDKKKLKGDIALLKNELEMLRFSDHPNIIQFYEIYQDNISYHFVMELCEGGDITTRLEKDGPFKEDQARRIIFQVLLAINHLHTCGIVHRDIKPDNFLFKSSDADSTIKLIDFGLSRKYQIGSKMKSVLGTPYYVAPEILEKRGYTEKCDVWSAGVMLYLLLVADFPFQGTTHAELFENIKQGEYSLRASKEIMALSKPGKDLLAKLLNTSPERRISAREALRDPWFDSINIEINERGRKQISVELLDRLRSFKRESMFSKEVIRLLVMLHDDDPAVLRLKDAFFYLDVLNNGVINKDELRNIFDELKEEVSEKELNDVINSLELRTKNVITYTEFITGVIDSSFFSKEDCLEEAFIRFDISGDGVISYEDIQDCFSRFGIDLKKDHILRMIDEMDLTDSGKVTKADFWKIMKGEFHTHISPKYSKPKLPAVES
jgi:calcium-dependent protein kinase